MKRLFVFFAVLRFLPISVGADFGNDRLKADLARWRNILKYEYSDFTLTAVLLARYPEFRNLYIFRHNKKRFYKRWAALWYKPMDTLFLQAKKIGGGLFIQHGFSTMVSAEAVGKNCWINQQVTIGFKDNTRAPVIGDNVTITCGAKVLGNITVGDNAVIGANAVVVKDVEPGSVMVGIPAKPLERKN